MFIELKNITKTYKPSRQVSVEALRGVNLKINRGDMVVITGVSGSGKSTLLHILGFMDRATSGELFFEEPIHARMSDAKLARLRNKKIGFVLQDFALVPYQTAYSNIEMPLIFGHVPRKERRQRIEKMCNELGITELKKRKVSQMSGGQKQRVAIARALVNNPDLILADEPTGALDKKTKSETLALIKKIHAEGKTVIIATHDLSIAEMADRRLHIEDGKIIELQEA